MPREDDARRRGRLNWLDWLLLACFLLAIAGGLLLWSAWRRGGDGDVGSVRYVVAISDCDWMDLAVGSSVRSRNGTAMLGRVTEIRAEPHRMLAVKDGALEEVAVDGRYDLFLTVEADGIREARDGIRVSDIRIAAGIHTELRVGARLALGAEIVSVEWRETDA